MNDNYILPSEFVMLLAFWFGPPLLVALLALAVPFAKSGLFRHHPSRAIFAFLLIIVASIALGLGGLIWSPPSLKFLGVKDIFLAGRSWPVLPLSFVAVAVAAPIIGWWALQANRPNPAFKRDALKRAP